MYVFDSLDHLVCQHQNCLETELPTTFSEEFLKTAAQSIHDHDIPFFVLAEPVNLRNSDAIMQNLVDFMLIQQL